MASQATVRALLAHSRRCFLGTWLRALALQPLVLVFHMASRGSSLGFEKLHGPPAKLRKEVVGPKAICIVFTLESRCLAPHFGAVSLDILPTRFITSRCASISTRVTGTVAAELTQSTSILTATGRSVIKPRETDTSVPMPSPRSMEPGSKSPWDLRNGLVIALPARRHWFVPLRNSRPRLTSLAAIDVIGLPYGRGDSSRQWQTAGRVCVGVRARKAR